MEVVDMRSQEAKSVVKPQMLFEVVENYPYPLATRPWSIDGSIRVPDGKSLLSVDQAVTATGRTAESLKKDWAGTWPREAFELDQQEMEALVDEDTTVFLKHSRQRQAATLRTIATSPAMEPAVAEAIEAVAKKLETQFQ